MFRAIILADNCLFFMSIKKGGPNLSPPCSRFYIPFKKVDKSSNNQAIAKNQNRLAVTMGIATKYPTTPKTPKINDTVHQIFFGAFSLMITPVIWLKWKELGGNFDASIKTIYWMWWEWNRFGNQNILNIYQKSWNSLKKKTYSKKSQFQWTASR